MVGTPRASERATPVGPASMLSRALTYKVPVWAIFVFLLFSLGAVGIFFFDDDTGAPSLGSVPWAGGGREDYCIQPTLPLQGPNSAFYYTKIYPAQANCTVRGLVIDLLEPWFNFRRPVTLRRTRGPDPSYMIPYFRAFQDLSLLERKRRVFLDLGANRFGSSVTFMLKNYPLEFTEIHAFEAVEGLFDLPKPRPKGERPPPITDLYETLNTRSEVKEEYASTWQKRPFPDEMLERIYAYNAYVGIEDKPAQGKNPASVNITRFIKDELQLTKDDAVIVKMDIEWAEWDVLPAWLADKEMPEIIDEIFVELHYQHPTTVHVGWRKGPSREFAEKIFHDMRRAGFFIHPWV